MNNQMDPRLAELQAFWDNGVELLEKAFHLALPYLGMALVVVFLVALCMRVRSERAAA